MSEKALKQYRNVLGQCIEHSEQQEAQALQLVAENNVLRVQLAEKSQPVEPAYNYRTFVSGVLVGGLAAGTGVCIMEDCPWEVSTGLAVTAGVLLGLEALQ